MSGNASSSLKRAFMRAAAVPFRTAWWLAKTFMAVTAASIPFAVAVYYHPHLTSTDLETYMKEKNIPVSVLEDVKTRNIRIYHRRNPLSYLHMPAFAAAQINSAINNPSPMGVKMMDWNEDGKIGSAEKAAAHIIGTAALYTLTLFTHGFNSMTGAAVTNAFGAASPTVFGKGDRCFIVPPGDGLTANQMLRAFTNIHSHAIDDRGVDDKTAFNYIMAHEFKHCDAGLVLVSRVGEEGAADFHAAEALKKPGLTNFIKHIRAVSTFAHDMYDNTHATALVIEAHQNARPMNVDDLKAIDRANGNLRALVDRKLAARRLENKTPAEPRYHAVYRIMKDLLKEGALSRDPLMKRAAALYVEGVEIFLPALRSKTAAAAPVV